MSLARHLGQRNLDAAFPVWSLVGPLFKVWLRPQARPPLTSPPLPRHPSYWPYSQVPPACVLKVSPLPVSEHVQWVRVDLVPRVINIYFLLSRCFSPLGPIPWLPGK